MRAVSITFTIMMFSVFMAIMNHAGIYDSSGTYYDNRIMDNMNESIKSYINETGETAQTEVSTNIVSIIFSTLTFGWVRTYIKPFGSDVETAFEPVFSGLAILGLFLVSVAVIEILWVKRDIMT